MSLALEILAMISGGKLKSITIQRSDLVISKPSLLISQHSQCCQSIVPFSSLRKVVVDWNSDTKLGGADDRSKEDIMSVLHPLWKLSELESLALKSIPACLYFSDSTITAISTAFLGIQVLQLEQAFWPDEYLPAFDLLAILATNHPELIKLSLTVDENRMSIPAANNISCHGLQELHLQHSILLRRVEVSSQIDTLFPNLRHFDAFDDDKDLIRKIIFHACRPAWRNQQIHDLLTCNHSHMVLVSD
jgi:hypothetical protein